MVLMNLLMQLTPAQLRKAADIQEKIEALKTELDQVLAVQVAAPTAALEASEPAKKGRKKFSAKTRAKMAAAQKARWAAKKGEIVTPAKPEIKATPAAPEPTREPKKTKKQASEARLKGLAKAREARWAKVRAAKKAKA